MAIRRRRKKKTSRRRNPEIPAKIVERLYTYEDKLDDALDYGDRLEIHLTGYPELKAVVHAANEAMSKAQEVIQNMYKNM